MIRVSLLLSVFFCQLSMGAQWLENETYGDASNGARTISSSVTESPIDSTCSGTVNGTSLSATNAGFAANQIILIHQSRGSGAGNWELNVIQSYVAGTITTKYPLANTYYLGGANAAQVLVVPQYSSVTVNSGQTWYPKAWNGSRGGILAFLCKGTVTVQGTINATGRGYRAGYGTAQGGSPLHAQQGEGYPNTQSLTRLRNGNGGGGGHKEGEYGAGGGGGGHGANGSEGGRESHKSPVEGGAAAGNTTLTSLVMGGGGGGGSGRSNTSSGGSGGSGGVGGGIVMILADTIDVSVGQIVAGGNNGGNASSSNNTQSGGGGGGAGGAVLLKGNVVNVGTTRVTAARGNGGADTGDYNNLNGGNGAVGRIAVHYGTSVNGSSTNPSITSVQNSELIPNLPPTAFDLSSPADGSHTGSNRPTLSWQASTDPEELGITYVIELADNSGFSPVYRTAGPQSETSYTPDAGSELADGTYYWRVTAYDDENALLSNQTWTLTVDTTLPQVPVLTRVSRHLPSGKFDRIIGNAEAGSTVSLWLWDVDTAQFAEANQSTSWSGDEFTITPDPGLDSGSRFYVSSADAALNERASRVHALRCEHTIDIWPDEDIYHGSGPGRSMRLEQDTSYSFNLAVNAGTAVTVTAWLRVNEDYSGTAPKLILSGLGINGTGAATASLTAAAGEWQQLTVTGSPNAQGVLNLTIESYSTASGAATWIDDVSVAQ